MPIFMRCSGPGTSAGGASGGVWKTSNFLTSDPIGPGFIPLSRISLVSGVGGVDDRDPMPSRKAAELFRSARSGGPVGRLYVATDTEVYNQPASANNRGKLLVGVDNSTLSDPLTGHTRLVFGSDQGVFSRPGIGVLKSSDGGSTWQTQHAPLVEIVVIDASGAGRQGFRLKNVTISRGPRGSLTLNYTGLE